MEEFVVEDSQETQPQRKEVGEEKERVTRRGRLESIHETRRDVNDPILVGRVDAHSGTWLLTLLLLSYARRNHTRDKATPLEFVAQTLFMCYKVTKGCARAQSFLDANAETVCRLREPPLRVK